MAESRVVRCPECGWERWAGIGPCSNPTCGALTAEGKAEQNRPTGRKVEDRIAAAVQEAALAIALDLERMAHLVPVFAAQQGFRVASQRVCAMHSIDHVLMVARPVNVEVERAYAEGAKARRVGDVMKATHKDFRIDWRTGRLICPDCGGDFGTSYDELVSVIRPHVEKHRQEDE